MPQLTDDDTFINSVRSLPGPVVIFGSGGFIGAGLLRSLLKIRQDVFGVTQQYYVPWRLRGIPAGNIVRCDQTRPDQVHSLLMAHRFKTVFAFAAYGAYSRQTDSDLIYRTNVQGLLNIVKTAMESGVERIVHAGSSSEYGLNCAGPSENAKMQPNSHYSVSKIAASHMVEYFGKFVGVPIVNLRFYSVYGPWEEPDRLIPRLIEFGKNKKYPRLVNPEISRDFLYVDDAIKAAVLAANVGCLLYPGESYNIGSGTKTTIRELAYTVRDIYKIPSDPPWGSMPNREWDLTDWYSNSNKAADELNWTASIKLPDGLTRTAQWIDDISHDGTRYSAGADPVHPVTKLSAVIACYKDAEAIPFMHERLTAVFSRLAVDYEIIFVNDCSPDNTTAIAGKLAATDHHVIVVEHSRNFGSQSAFLSGMEIATGDAVILLDGDLQDPPEIIPEFFDQWTLGYEVVFGQRIRREGNRLLGVAYKLFYRLFRRLSNVPMPLDAGDFSLIDRKVVNELLSLPESDQFLRGLRAWLGFRQTGVPYVRPERMFGRTTNNLRKNFWWARKAIFSFSFAPLEWLIYGGLGLVALSIFGIGFQIISKFLHPETPHGFSTVIVLLLFFGGTNLLGISIVGEYVGKILEETKGRPKFIRRKLIVAGREYSNRNEILEIINERAGVGRAD